MSVGTRTAGLRLVLQGHQQVLGSLQQIERTLLSIERLSTQRMAGVGGAAGGGAGFGAQDLKRPLLDMEGSISRLTAAISLLNGVRAAVSFANIERWGTEAAAVEGLVTAFEHVSGGAQQATPRLKALEAATDGLAAKGQLMQAVLRLQAAGVSASDEQVGKLIANTTKLSRVFGEDVSTSIDRVILGIARLQPQLLDNIGVTLRIEEVVRKYAEANGISASAVSEHQKQQLILTEALKQSDVAVRALGLGTLESADNFVRGQAVINNFVGSMASLGPAVNAAYKAAGTAAAQTFMTAFAFGASTLLTGPGSFIARLLGLAVSSSAASLAAGGIAGIAGATATGAISGLGALNAPASVNVQQNLILPPSTVDQAAVRAGQAAASSVRERLGEIDQSVRFRVRNGVETALGAGLSF